MIVMDEKAKKGLRKKYDIRCKLHDFCMTERAGKGCAGCPLDSLDICSKDIMRDVDIRRLLKLSQIIDEILNKKDDAK